MKIASARTSLAVTLIWLVEPVKVAERFCAALVRCTGECVQVDELLVQHWCGGPVNVCRLMGYSRQ